MKVSQAEFLDQYNKAERIHRENNKADGTKKGKESGESQFREVLDSYQSEDGLNETNAAYTNPKVRMDTVTMERLLQETEEIRGSVHQMIREFLDRQGKTEEQLKSAGEGEGELTVDEIAREEAEKLLGPGGALSPEAVSDRIVNFSIAVFGGDTGKVDVIRSAIDRGFDEAERMLGHLADVSKETYGLIQEKLDQWVNGPEEETGQDESQAGDNA
ncbi:MAG: hypothetical protein GY940_34585 [bacterium]|nr:hypothetical protein [bacterium]